MPHASTMALVLCLGITATANAQKKDPPPSPATAAKIASARSAAPAAISANATIAEMGADGKMTVLVKGTNGWLCLPDDPSTPGPDPMCADKTWQQWFEGYSTHKPPTVTQVGIAYMLGGDAGAPSNTDPFAMKPAAGQTWVMTPPHTMILLPDTKQLDSYSATPSMSSPYVMWKGTPYAHLMVPVKP
jgi:hypothetical protein